MVITEGLQELKTLKKRIEKKRSFIKAYLWRQDLIKDPLEANGGAFKCIENERHAIADLENNYIDIKNRINAANAKVTLTLQGITKSIADWIVWKRDIAPSQKNFINELTQSISNARNAHLQKSRTTPTTYMDNRESKDLYKLEMIINIDEKKLADSYEMIETLLSMLDGQLSLLNATISI